MNAMYTSHITIVGAIEEVSEVCDFLIENNIIPEDNFMFCEDAAFLAPLLTKTKVPVDIVKGLSEVFTNVYFNLEYRANNISGVCGLYSFNNGNTTCCDIPDPDSDEAKDFYDCLCDDENEFWKTEEGDVRYLEFSPFGANN